MSLFFLFLPWTLAQVRSNGQEIAVEIANFESTFYPGHTIQLRWTAKPALCADARNANGYVPLVQIDIVRFQDIASKSDFPWQVGVLGVVECTDERFFFQVPDTLSYFWEDAAPEPFIPFLYSVVLLYRDKLDAGSYAFFPKFEIDAPFEAKPTPMSNTLPSGEKGCTGCVCERGMCFDANASCQVDTCQLPPSARPVPKMCSNRAGCGCMAMDGCDRTRGLTCERQRCVFLDTPPPEYVPPITPPPTPAPPQPESGSAGSRPGGFFEPPSVSPSGNNTLIFGLIGGVVLFLIVLGAIAFFVIKKKENAKMIQLAKQRSLPAAPGDSAPNNATQVSLSVSNSSYDPGSLSSTLPEATYAPPYSQSSSEWGASQRQLDHSNSYQDLSIAHRPTIVNSSGSPQPYFTCYQCGATFYTQEEHTQHHAMEHSYVSGTHLFKHSG